MCLNFASCFSEEAGPAFEEFMNLIGEKVMLKGFQGYRAQLDNRSKFNYWQLLYDKEAFVE